MSLRSDLVANLIVQAFGPASAFLAVLIVARVGGPVDQGQFARYKAWVDALVAVGCLGLPQGFVYVVNRLGASTSLLARWTVAYAILLVPVAFAGLLAFLRLFPAARSAEVSSGTVGVLSLAGALLVLQSLWRGLFLARSSGIAFAVFTILPAVGSLAAVAAAMAQGAPRFDLVILAGAALALAPATWMMVPALRARPGVSLRDEPWRELLTNGFQSFLQAVLVSLQPVVAFAAIGSAGAASADSGFLAAALFVVQGLTVPISMVAPVLFARWTSDAGGSPVGVLHARTARWITLGVVAVAPLVAVAHLAVPALFGESYVAAVLPTQVMLLTLPIALHARVIAPALHAAGHPGANTAACGLRLAVFGLAAFAGAGLLDRLLAVAAAWSIAELVGSVWTLVTLRALARTPGRS